METGIEISDLPRIHTRAEIDGFRVKNAGELKDKYILASEVFNGMLFPNTSNNLMMDGIGILNIRELSLVGLANIVPYFQKQYSDIYTESGQTDLDTPFTSVIRSFNPFDSGMTMAGSKNFSIVEVSAQADYHMMVFPRAGFYSGNILVESSVIWKNLKSHIEGIGSLHGALNMFITGESILYDFDESENTVTAIDSQTLDIDNTGNNSGFIINSDVVEENREVKAFTNINFSIMIKDPLVNRLKIQLRFKYDIHATQISSGVDRPIDFTGIECNNETNIGIYSRR